MTPASIIASFMTDSSLEPFKLSLRLWSDAYSIGRLDADAPIPGWATAGRFFAIARTALELSVVCASALVPQDATARHGWRCLAVDGPLDFDLIGVLAELSGTLADAGVSIFAVSTYDTDHLLVREGDVQLA